MQTTTTTTTKTTTTTTTTTSISTTKEPMYKLPAQNKVIMHNYVPCNISTTKKASK